MGGALGRVLTGSSSVEDENASPYQGNHSRTEIENDPSVSGLFRQTRFEPPSARAPRASSRASPVWPQCAVELTRVSRPACALRAVRHLSPSNPWLPMHSPEQLVEISGAFNKFGQPTLPALAAPTPWPGAHRSCSGRRRALRRRSPAPPVECAR